MMDLPISRIRDLGIPILNLQTPANSVLRMTPLPRSPETVEIQATSYQIQRQICKVICWLDASFSLQDCSC